LRSDIGFSCLSVVYRDANRIGYHLLTAGTPALAPVGEQIHGVRVGEHDLNVAGKVLAVVGRRMVFIHLRRRYDRVAKSAVLRGVVGEHGSTVVRQARHFTGKIDSHLRRTNLVE
jgi:hypothetical protein